MTGGVREYLHLTLGGPWTTRESWFRPNSVRNSVSLRGHHTCILCITSRRTQWLYSLVFALFTGLLLGRVITEWFGIRSYLWSRPETTYPCPSTGGLDRFGESRSAVRDRGRRAVRHKSPVPLPRDRPRGQGWGWFVTGWHLPSLTSSVRTLKRLPQGCRLRSWPKESVSSAVSLSSGWVCTSKDQGG